MCACGEEKALVRRRVESRETLRAMWFEGGLMREMRGREGEEDGEGEGNGRGEWSGERRSRTCASESGRISLVGAR